MKKLPYNVWDDELNGRRDRWPTGVALAFQFVASVGLWVILLATLIEIAALAHGSRP